MKKILTYSIVIIAVSAFCGLAGGCSSQSKSNAPAAAGVQVIPVKTETVKLSDISEYVEYVANIKAQQEVFVFPKVTGKIIKKVKEEGDIVAQGDVIAYVDRDEVGLTFEQAPVESPLAGFVGKVLVDIGTNVSPQAPVALVVDMEKVKVFVDVPEKYLPRISLGMAATVGIEAYPDEIFTGSIARVSPVVDVATRTCQV
ncbi:MAG: efflux RND transporter periplasmic adaptor subunit, partial [Candidatus Omnitrophota bacterium]